MKKEKDENQVEMKLDNFAENEKNAKKEKLIEEIKKEKTNNKTECDEKMTEAEKVNKIVKKANNKRTRLWERADKKPAALSMAISFNKRSLKPA